MLPGNENERIAPSKWLMPSPKWPGDRALSDEGSEVQVIIISNLLEKGLNNQSDPKKVTLAECREASPAPTAIQMVHPPRASR